MTHDARTTLRLALLWLRLALGAHALYWGAALLSGGRAVTQLPFSEAQLSSSTLALSIAATGLFTLAGMWRPFSYGVLLFLHAVVTFASYAAVLTPFSALAGRTVATLPLLGAAALLFVLRDQDSLLSADVGLKSLARLIARHETRVAPQPALEPETISDAGSGPAG